MYWIEHNPNDVYLRREKVFPPAALTREFDKSHWVPGIRIGGEVSQLDVNFCYNTMCGHFGVSQSEAIKNEQQPYGIRRKGNLLNLMCPECGLTRKIYNNQAVSDMFLHVLKNHLTHEYCPQPSCDNYRHNLHEYYSEAYKTLTDVPTDEHELKNYKLSNWTVKT